MARPPLLSQEGYTLSKYFKLRHYLRLEYLAFMTRYSHNEDMKTAKVSELKAKLSAYLSEVRGGGTVIVYDRNTPIARLIPFQEEADDLIIIESSAAPSLLKKIKGVRPKKRVDIDKLLRELRGN